MPTDSGTRQKPVDNRGHYLMLVVIAVLLLVSIAFRVWKLGSVPGLNGDEAWYGIQAHRLWTGELDTWTTPTNNPPNPFFFLPVLLLNAISQPSVFLLRIVPLVSGILLLIVNFAVCRRQHGIRTAVTSTLFFAVLPVCIAYSRFAWDTSQSVLATLLPIYCCLAALEAQRYWPWLIAAGVLQLLACWVHPTNIFSSPVLMMSFVHCVARSENDATNSSVTDWLRRGIQGFVCLVSIVLIAQAGVGAASEFFVALVRLFNGTTIFQYISGAGIGEPVTSIFAEPWFDAASIGFVLLLLLASIAGFVADTRRREQGVVLGIGLLFAVAMFFRIGGSDAANPGFERYSIWLVAPAAMFATLGIQTWLRRHWFTAGMLVAAGLMLTIFYFNYFRHIELTGGTGPPPLRTSDVEPKQAALDFVLSNAHSSDRLLILTDDWWIYYPLTYLAPRQMASVDVRRAEEFPEPGKIEISNYDSVWLVSWDRTEPKWKQQEFPADYLDFARNQFPDSVKHEIRDGGDRPLIVIYGRLSRK